MKTIGQRIDQFLWNNEYDYFNKVGYSAPFISFISMQIIRLICMIFIFIVWCMNVYINVKKSVIYINIWGLTFTLFAFGFLFVSSGR